MQLGITVTDKITGFTGIVTGLATFINGYNQALVTPRAGQDGGLVDSSWFDEQRLVVNKSAPLVTLDNGPA